MKFTQATLADFATVKDIVRTAIHAIYPHYYPRGGVEFFLQHHSDENIRKGIETETVLLLDLDGVIVGTGSAKKNEIGRVFILPQLQGLGYGTALMNELETIIGRQYSHILLDSSLPAYDLYIKRGYSPVKYEKIITPSKDVLCFNVMGKAVHEAVEGKISFNNRMFASVSNTKNGEVSSATTFHYHQNKNLVWAEYKGGEIVEGFLIGTSDENSHLNFTYEHTNQAGEIRTGKCVSTPEILPNEKIRLLEQWQWTNGDCSTGQSIIEEIDTPSKTVIVKGFQP